MKRPRNRQERRKNLQRPLSVELSPSRTQWIRQRLRRAWRVSDIVKASACALGALGLMKIFELVAPSSPTGWLIAVLMLGLPAMSLIAIAGFLAIRARFRMFGVH